MKGKESEKKPWDKPERHMTEEDWAALEAEAIRIHGTKEAAERFYREVCEGLDHPLDVLE